MQAIWNSCIMHLSSWMPFISSGAHFSRAGEGNTKKNKYGSVPPQGRDWTRFMFSYVIDIFLQKFSTGTLFDVSIRVLLLFPFFPVFISTVFVWFFIIQLCLYFHSVASLSGYLNEDISSRALLLIEFFIPKDKYIFRVVIRKLKVNIYVFCFRLTNILGEMLYFLF